METKYLFSFLLLQNKREKGITYTEFAKTIGVCVSTISKLANGLEKPTDKHRLMIAKYFNLNPEDIIFAADNDLTIREVIKQKEGEIKYWQEKFIEVLGKLESTNEQLHEYRKLIKDLRWQMSQQLDVTETYDLSFYKDLRKEVTSK